MNICTLFRIFFAAAAAGSAAAQTYPLSGNYWKNPEFQDRVMGSYGIHSELEPKISEEEMILFRELMVLLEASLEQGKTRLKSSITPTSSAALDFMLGTVHLQLNESTEAVASYQAAIKKFPNFMRAYKNAGYALTQSQQLEEAVPYLIKGLELGGSDGTTYGLLGYCYLNLKKYGAALNAYNLAMAFSPDSKDWKLGKVRCLVYMKDYAGASGLIEDMILDDPDNAELWLHQANSKLALDASAEAATNLEIVRRMGKATVDSLTLLADIYENQEMHRLAYLAYEEAMKQPDGLKAVAKAPRLLGSFMQYEQYEYAEKLIELAFSQHGERLEKSQRLELLNARAAVELAMERSDKAAETLAAIVEENPMDGQALILLAKHAWSKGDYEEAAFQFERAASVERVASIALLQHGQMEVQRKDYATAAKLIRESLDLKFSPLVADYLRDVEEAAARIF